jgi:hypothetical protein
VFKAQQQDITMGSFKGAILPYPGYAKVPDFVTIDRSSMVMAIGEAKVPWIIQRSLRAALRDLTSGREGLTGHLFG